ncbi:hypothetical protein Tco_1167903, partial [Tanacetum coccineum]
MVHGGSGTRIQVWHEDAGLLGSVPSSEKEAYGRLTWRTLIGGSRNGSGGYQVGNPEAIISHLLAVKGHV